MNLKFKKRNKGFTLIELMVSLSIFVVIMTLVMGSILNAFDLNSKSQSQKTAGDNLNFALESIARTIRFGTNFHCGATAPLNTPNDCASGSSSFSVTGADGILVTYTLSNGAITRSLAGATAQVMTSPEVSITSLAFRVFGSTSYASGDYLQPQVIITMSGTVGSSNKAKTQSTFHVETTVSQRKLDI